MPDNLRALLAAATPIGNGYHVDANGNVLSTTRWRGHDIRLLQPDYDTDGYFRVRLTIRGNRMSVDVHRLVCTAFHGPKPSPDHEVRHLNGDRTDNRAANLAWGTRAENAADGRGTEGEEATRG